MVTSWVVDKMPPGPRYALDPDQASQPTTPGDNIHLNAPARLPKY